MQVPVPRAALECRLGVHRVVPAPDTQLDPAFRIHRHPRFPQTPRVEVLWRERIRLVPDRATVHANLDTGRETLAAVGPPPEEDLAVMHDNVEVVGGHDCRRDGHVLDTPASRVAGVEFTHLISIVDVLLLLDWGTRLLRQDADTSKPFAGAGADVAEDDDADRIAMNIGQRLAIHIPGEHRFMNFAFAPWDADGIVVHLALFVVGISTKKLKMLTTLLETTAVLNDLLEADTRPACIANGALAPRSIDEFVAIARIGVDLLDAPRTRALDGRHNGHARELVLVLQIRQRETLWAIDQPRNIHKPGIFINMGNASVVANEEILVRSERICHEARVWRLAVIGKLQQMQHVFALFLFDAFPALLVQVREAECVVILLPSLAEKNRVAPGKRLQLEFRKLRLDSAHS